jgi:hypothetical protein
MRPRDDPFRGARGDKRQDETIVLSREELAALAARGTGPGGRPAPGPRPAGSRGYGPAPVRPAPNGRPGPDPRAAGGARAVRPSGNGWDARPAASGRGGPGPAARGPVRREGPSAPAWEAPVASPAGGGARTVVLAGAALVLVLLVALAVFTVLL